MNNRTSRSSEHCHKQLKNHPGWRSWAPWLLLFLTGMLFILSAEYAFARIGGGEGFGGGGGGWGGGGDGGGGLILLLIRLVLILIIEKPVIGVPAGILVTAGTYYYVFHKQDIFDRDSDSVWISPADRNLQISKRASRNLYVDRLKEEDPNFSRPVFIDFARMLFDRVHRARPGKRGQLHNYISDAAWYKLKELSNPELVDSVLIGSIQIQSIRFPVNRQEIGVRFEANYREHPAEGGSPKDLHTVELWKFSREKGVLSRKPEEVKSLACPNCGSTAEPETDGTCPHCGTVVNRGNFDWRIEYISIQKRRPIPEMDFSGEADRGTLLPTVWQNDLAAQRRAFRMRNPDWTPENFKHYAEEVFRTLQNAWSEKNLEEIRPHETDNLFQQHSYWINRFRREGITNVIEDIQIEKMDLCRFEKDAFYESLTVRIGARMVDYKKNDRGDIIAGSKQPVAFSEYWCFIRRRGAEKEAFSKKANCPSCGAELQLNREGICEYCESRITSGNFYWVLSSIEQDEAYRG